MPAFEWRMDGIPDYDRFKRVAVMLVSVITIFVLDSHTPANVVVPFLYVFIPFLYPRSHDRTALWLAACACVVFTMLAPAIGPAPTIGVPEWVIWMNRLFAALAMLGVAYATDVRLRGDLQRQQVGSDLLEAVRNRDVFLAVLAHELRNPLAPIHHGIQVLKTKGSQKPGPEQAEKIFDMMERQTRTLIRLVDDLLEISRYSTGKIQIEKEPVDMAAVLRSAIEASQPLIESAKHKLSTSIPQTLPRLESDPVRLSQAFTNLLNNASKFTPGGGSINLSAEPTDHAIRVVVSDSGRGIAPEILPGIFDLYIQASNFRKTERGLGIGLALVKEIVESHGGSVIAESEGLDKGSKFVVLLPVQQKQGTPNTLSSR